MEAYVRKALQDFGVDASQIEVFRPADAAPATLAALRQILAKNEQSDRDIILVYFNQGVLTGSWDGPHVSPIGASDGEAQRVLILDVDRGWYVPYWSSDSTLLEAMRRPAPPDQGLLAGETGGLIRVSRAAAED